MMPIIDNINRPVAALVSTGRILRFATTRIATGWATVEVTASVRSPIAQPAKMTLPLLRT